MKSIARLSIILIFVFVSGLGVIFFLPLPPLLPEKSHSIVLYDCHHNLLRITLSADEKYRIWTPLKDISPVMQATTLLQEDKFFYKHFGVNPISLFKGFIQTYIHHSRRVGASTITMQVARMRYKINSKNLCGKIIQILRATQLEMHYSKSQLLEAYFNLAPYGNNIEGIGAASLIYFNKQPKNLSLNESLLLSVIPQNPAARPTHAHLKNIRDHLYDRWIKLHPKDTSKKSLIDLPLQIPNLHHLPFNAPHFVNDVMQHSAILHDDKDELRTTLDLELQNIIEKMTQHYIAHNSIYGVHNASILLIDARTMTVKAMLGSNNYFDKNIQGQINGTQIKRSPGSTLKPFIYALALDQGLIHPNSILKDVPHSFGSYNPDNFDYDFLGPIKAKDALILSRNIPAIFLADQLKNPDLYGLLVKAHIQHLKSQSYYGLSLVLGGAEVTMQELISLYSALLNDGIWHGLRFTNQDSFDTGVRLFSPEASFLILNMLKETTLPSGTFNNKDLHSQVAWKTGTSSGFKDAWTVGIFGNYVLAVWIGNFDGTSNHAFVGKNIAAPLFFEIVNALKTKLDIQNNSWNIPLKHLNLVKIPICKASGLLPTVFCHDQELGWFIPGKSPIKTDNIFREAAIDPKTGLRTCKVNANTKFEIFEFWPSDIIKILKQAGLQPKTPPPFDATCQNVNSFSLSVGVSPQITSPHSEVEYFIGGNSQKTNIIPFTAVTDSDVEYVHWFIDSNYLGKKAHDSPLLWHAKPGKYLLRVVDDHGRTDEVKLIVKGHV